MTSGFTFFGVHRSFDGELDHPGTWFMGHTVLWEKEGRLHLFYTDREGHRLDPEAHPTPFCTKNALLTDRATALFLDLSNENEKRTQLPLPDLSDDEVRKLLLTYDTETRAHDYKPWREFDPPHEKKSETLRLSRIMTRDHHAIMFLADPATYDPANGEYWGAWGMPNGKMVVGPLDQINAELDALRRSNWHNLSPGMRSELVVNLLRSPNYADLSREVRVAGLKGFYDNFTKGDTSDWSLKNGRYNTESWAERYFKLENDPLALPWV